MNELNGQIDIELISAFPKRLISLAECNSTAPNPYRNKELIAVVNILSKIIEYVVFIDNHAILSTDNLIKAMAAYNTIK